MRPWSALAFRDYRFLWMGSVAAMMTMGLRVTGTAVWLYEETGSGADLAWLGIIELGMRIPANLYGGALADEVDRKKLMAATQAASFTLIGLMMVVGSGLSFLGLGIQPPEADWGTMVAEGRGVLRKAPHVTIFPGVVIVLVALSFNFIGDGLRDALDPKSSKD